MDNSLLVTVTRVG